MNLISIPEKEFKPGKELELFPDGTLIEYKWDGGIEREYVMEDISEEIMFHLDQHVVLSSGVTLNSLFSLISRNEIKILNIIFHNCFLDALIKHYHSIDLVEVTSYLMEYDPDKIDYLELHWFLYKNSKTKTLYGYNRPHFSGVGVEQHEDYLEDGVLMVSKGKRMNWSISVQPLNECLNIPLVLNTEASIIEDDHTNPHYYDVLDTVIMEYTLRDLIYGIFWELSFYGTPTETQDVKRSLDDIVVRIKNGSTTSRPFDAISTLDDSESLLN